MQQLDIMRRLNASVRSASDSWADAIVAAEAGDATRLLDCARGYKPFAHGDRELLARYVARKLRRRRFWPPELERVLSRARDDFDLPHVVGLDLLATLIEKRMPGRTDVPVHRTAREVEIALRTIWPGRVPDELRQAVIERYCTVIGHDSGVTIDPERVRDLLSRQKVRRRKHY